MHWAIKATAITAVCVVLVPTLLFAVLSWTSKPPAGLGLGADGKLRKCPASPNCVCSEGGEDAGHTCLSLTFTEEPAAAWKRLADIINTMPNGKVVRDDGNYLHAEFTSRLFRFVDDLECRLDPAGKTIALRSASRVGHSDLGVNAARVAELRKRFEAK